MEEYKLFLEQEFKDLMYRDDGSPLAELQYDLQLLAQCIEEMLRICTYKNVNLKERTTDFTKCKKKYLNTLAKTIDDFTNTSNKKNPIDTDFVVTINVDSEDLMRDYYRRINRMSEKEAKAINELIFSYQILLRLINTYIKHRNPELELITVSEPLAYDKEPEDYIQYLNDFVGDQKKIKLEEKE